jgi:hypothetical protein
MKVSLKKLYELYFVTIYRNREAKQKHSAPKQKLSKTTITVQQAGNNLINKITKP